MSYEGADRRDRDRDPVLTQLMALGKTVNDNHAATIKTLGDMNTALQVHVVEDKAVAEKVEKHEEKWEGLEKAKNRGFVLTIFALLSSGALGVWGKDVAMAAKKLFE